jgi:hypothetical protein
MPAAVRAISWQSRLVWTEWGEVVCIAYYICTVFGVEQFQPGNFTESSFQRF